MSSNLPPSLEVEAARIWKRCLKERKQQEKDFAATIGPTIQIVCEECGEIMATHTMGDELAQPKISAQTLAEHRRAFKCFFGHTDSADILPHPRSADFSYSGDEISFFEHIEIERRKHYESIGEKFEDHHEKGPRLQKIWENHMERLGLSKWGDYNVIVKHQPLEGGPDISEHLEWAPRDVQVDNSGTRIQLKHEDGSGVMYCKLKQTFEAEEEVIAHIEEIKIEAGHADREEVREKLLKRLLRCCKNEAVSAETEEKLAKMVERIGGKKVSLTTLRKKAATEVKEELKKQKEERLAQLAEAERVLAEEKERLLGL